MTTNSKVQRASTLEIRHLSSGLPRTSSVPHLPFSDYVALSRNRLRSARDRLPADILDKIVDGNAPFELTPATKSSRGSSRPFPRGILLVHGLSDSPYFMKYLGAYFQDGGFRVMSILLPGHGTQPGDLLNATWSEWAREVAYGVEQLAEEVEEIYLAGFSAGGALSVYQSLVDVRISGLFLFSPALSISRKAMLANLHRIYSWLIPSGQWLDIRPDADLYKYESFPKNAAAQMYALTRRVASLTKRRRLDIPVFIAASADDTTVDVAATIEYFAAAEHGCNKMVLYVSDSIESRTHQESAKCCSKGGRVKFVDCVFPEQRILSSSHAAVVLPAEDSHYGSHGEYAACAHYCPDEMAKYRACVDEPEVCLFGELTSENLARGIVRRLTYNPHFDELKSAMSLFIDSLPAK